MANHRIGTLLSLMFAAFLRVSEAISLTRDDVSFLPDRMDITIKKSKTDQIGKSEVRPVVRTNSDTCPVSNLQKWLTQLPSSTSFLFPAFSGTGQPIERHMSADHVRRELKRVLGTCDIQRKLTPHSFRGGAATAAIERGVPTRAVMAAGRWKSAGGFAPYISENVSTLAGATALL